MVPTTFQLLLTAIAAVAAAVSAIFSNLNREKIKQVGKDVAVVTLQINGRMEQLVEAARAEGYARGLVTPVPEPVPSPGPVAPAPVPGALPLPFTVEFPHGLLRGARGSLQAPRDIPPGKYRLVPALEQTA